MHKIIFIILNLQNTHHIFPQTTKKEVQKNLCLLIPSNNKIKNYVNDRIFNICLWGK
jgi:hypothetical protein